MKRRPFFIIGCVRSGTTMLRDLLRLHPNLAAPEETHFYRWSEPFGTKGQTDVLTGNRVLKKHRQLDSISEDEFKGLVQGSNSRAELYKRYMELYVAKNKPKARRWFDKTPQNIYGAAMVASEFPGAKFVHIVRNPLDVVASLRVGSVMKIENLVGACNYWNEAAEIMLVLKRARPKLVYEVQYEEFCRQPAVETRRLLDFVGEEYQPEYFHGVKIAPKSYRSTQMFSADELRTINSICGQNARLYGYDIATDTCCVGNAAAC